MIIAQSFKKYKKVDYFNTFAIVVKVNIIKDCLVLSVKKHLRFYQINMINAFSNSYWSNASIYRCRNTFILEIITKFFFALSGVFA